MRRAAVGLGSEVAEGFECGSRKQTIGAGYRTEASAGELRRRIVTAQGPGAIDARTFEDLDGRSGRGPRMLAACIRNLAAGQRGFPGVTVAGAQAARAAPGRRVAGHRQVPRGRPVALRPGELVTPDRGHRATSPRRGRD